MTTSTTHPSKLALFSFLGAIAIISLQSKTHGSTIILGNLDVPNDGLANPIGTSATNPFGRIFRAVAFTMPDESFFLEGVSVVLSGFLGGNGTPAVSLFDDDGAGLGPGSLYASLVGVPPSPFLGISTTSFEPSAPVILEASQTYWLIVDDAGIGQYGWVITDPVTPPTGAARLEMTLVTSNSGTLFNLTDSWNQFAIVGTPVPEPSTAAMGVLCLLPALARRKRRRF